jgi:hypothetical protein
MGMKYLYGKTPAAKLLEILVNEETAFIRRKVMTSLSEYNYALRGLSDVKDDTLFFYFLNLVPVDTKLDLPTKIASVMRNVKIGNRRREIEKRKAKRQE